MATNHDPETGIAYGYIRADAIHPELLDQLTIHNGTNVSYNNALNQYLAEKRREHETMIEEKRIARAELDGGTLSDEEDIEFDEDEARQKFSDEYANDEDCYEGTHEGVSYSSSWMGGVMNLWIFQSHVIVKCAQCSPCVPGAGDLDNFGSYEAYGVPVDWLDGYFLRELCDKAGFTLEHVDGKVYWDSNTELGRGDGFATEEEALVDCYNKNIVVPGNVTKEQNHD